MNPFTPMLLVPYRDCVLPKCRRDEKSYSYNQDTEARVCVKFLYSISFPWGDFHCSIFSNLFVLENKKEIFLENEPKCFFQRRYLHFTALQGAKERFFGFFGGELQYFTFCTFICRISNFVNRCSVHFTLKDPTRSTVALSNT